MSPVSSPETSETRRTAREILATTAIVDGRTGDTLPYIMPHLPPNLLPSLLGPWEYHGPQQKYHTHFSCQCARPWH